MKLFSERNSVGSCFILLAAMLWGTTGTAQEFAPAGATPITVGTVRLAVGGTVLLVLAGVRKQFSTTQRAWPLRSTLVSAFFVASYQLCFFAAVSKTGVAIGTMTAIGSSPIAAGILGYYFRNEHLDFKWCVATFFAVVGCVWLSLSSGQLDLELLGVFLALGAGGSYAMYTVSLKGLLDRHPPDVVMAVVFCSAALMMAPALFFSSPTWVLSLRGMAVALHLGIVTAALSYWLYARGLKIIKVGHVATLSLAEPLTASMLGVFVLSEHLGFWEFAGVVSIFIGILVLSIPVARLVGR